jgi:hypothetical protein
VTKTKETIQRDTLKNLDETLHNLQGGIKKLSEALSAAIDALVVEETDPLLLIKGAESLSRTIEKLVIVAPFLSFRNDFEAIEALKVWLTQSTIYVGEERGAMLLMLCSYQADLLRYITPEFTQQMTLL